MSNKTEGLLEHALSCSGGEGSVHSLKVSAIYWPENSPILVRTGCTGASEQTGRGVG